MPLKDSKYVQAPTIRVGTANSAYLLCANGQNFSLKGTRELLKSDGNFLTLGYTYTTDELKNNPSALATMSAVQTLIKESEDTPKDVYLHDRVTIHNDANALGANLTLDPAKGVFLAAKSGNDPAGEEKSVGMYWNSSPKYCGTVVRSPLLVTAGTCALSVTASSVKIKAKDSSVCLSNGLINIASTNGVYYNSPFENTWRCANSLYVPTVSIVHCLTAQKISELPGDNFYLETGYESGALFRCMSASIVLNAPCYTGPWFRLRTCPNRIQMAASYDGNCGSGYLRLCPESIVMRSGSGAFSDGIVVQGDLFVARNCSDTCGSIVFGAPVPIGSNGISSANRTMLLTAGRARNLPTENSSLIDYFEDQDGYAPLIVRSLYPVTMQFVRNSIMYNLCEYSQQLATVSIVNGIVSSLGVKNYDSCINAINTTIANMQSSYVLKSEYALVAECTGNLAGALSEVELCAAALRSDVAVLQSEVAELKKR